MTQRSSSRSAMLGGVDKFVPESHGGRLERHALNCQFRSHDYQLKTVNFNERHNVRFLIATLPAALLVGCGESSPVKNVDAEIANPASEHCVKIGGKVEIRKETNGEVGYCHLPDGSIVEEWKLFRSSVDDPAKP